MKLLWKLRALLAAVACGAFFWFATIPMFTSDQDPGFIWLLFVIVVSVVGVLAVMETGMSQLFDWFSGPVDTGSVAGGRIRITAR